jgi:hypothetical protein
MGPGPLRTFLGPAAGEAYLVFKRTLCTFHSQEKEPTRQGLQGQASEKKRGGKTVLHFQAGESIL